MVAAGVYAINEGEDEVEESLEFTAHFFRILRTFIHGAAASGMPRIQTRLLADIAGLFHSEYVTERLRKAQTPEAVIEAICAGQEAATD
jgi:hypothetical protein